ncbi:MAG: Crp/Fnr family transcriptional regulator [Thalassobaculaceae bacterium]|nr:Crp/Fnr family transcriptional regulator [Thalassobaculaceae bacterium]
MVTDTAGKQLNIMTEYLFRKLSGMITVTDVMTSAFTIVCTDKVKFAKGDYIVRPGDKFKAVYLIVDGWATRSKLTSNGARQIINFAIPGDILCFNAALFETAEVFVQAHTVIDAFAIPIRPFSDLLNKQPQLAVALAWTAAQEEGVVSERLLSLGRRSARQRAAHLLCEVHRRLQVVDLVRAEAQFQLPLTQEDLADSLGISMIHTNRVLRELVRGGLIAMERNSMKLLDLKRLREISEFSDDYLHFPAGS